MNYLFGFLPVRWYYKNNGFIFFQADKRSSGY